MTITEIILQTVVAILTGASIWALAGKRSRLGFSLGLAAQPIWLYSTWSAAQWGMFACAIWITYQYLRGLVNHRTLKTEQ